MRAERIFRNIRELLDVNTADLADGLTLVWDAATQRFVFRAASGGGATPPDTTVATEAGIPYGVADVGGSSYAWAIIESVPIQVQNGIAQMTVNGGAYEWPVSTGGPGAPAGTFYTDGSIIAFTVFATNYFFPVSLIP